MQRVNYHKENNRITSQSTCSVHVPTLSYRPHGTTKFSQTFHPFLPISLKFGVYSSNVHHACGAKLFSSRAKRHLTRYLLHLVKLKDKTSGNFYPIHTARDFEHGPKCGQITDMTPSVLAVLTSPDQDTAFVIADRPAGGRTSRRFAAALVRGE